MIPLPQHKGLMCHAIAAAMASIGGSLFAAGAADFPIPDGHVLPAQYLESLTPPTFARGHTLPRLTRYAYILYFDTRVHFARHWGYALELGTTTWTNGYATASEVDDALANPASDAARCMKLAAENPENSRCR